MKYTEIIAVTAFIILFTASSSEIISDTSIDNYDILLYSDSYVPEEEAYIHIAGGFFSVFEGKGGIIIDSDNYNSNDLPKDYKTNKNKSDKDVSSMEKIVIINKIGITAIS